MNSVRLVILFLNAFSAVVFCADWPMWRYNAGRTAAGIEELPEQLYCQWIRQYPARETVWDDSLNQDLMPLDTVFEPIVLGQTLFFCFNDQDKMVALDIHTGKLKWEFYCNGPIRLPPAGWHDHVYCTSDDGYLYCLSAETGDLLWKFQGAPIERNILGNKRLISSWPARGGVVIQNDIVYFCAGIWPFMGIFVYALDAQSGAIVWQNDGTGSRYMIQPHTSPAFAGVAPQGALAINGRHLLVPGGRSTPACFDLYNGDLLYYRFGEFNKTGGAFVCTEDDVFFNHLRERVVDMYDVNTGSSIARQLGKYPVLFNHRFYMSGDSIVVRSAQNPKAILQSLKIDAGGDLIKSGSRFYAGGLGLLSSLGFNKEGQLQLQWQEKVEGRVGRLLAANGMLFVVTLDGKIMAYGQTKRIVKTIDSERNLQQNSKNTAWAASVLQQTQVQDGYALLYNVPDIGLAAALARQSRLNLIVIESEQSRILKMRQELARMGLSAARVHVQYGTAADFSAPPYMASLIILFTPISQVMQEKIFAKMVQQTRPYGGKIYLRINKEQHSLFEHWLVKQDNAMLSIHSFENSLLISKNGALPGAADWTHQYGNIANTVKSDDELVKLPLGVLWFGGVSNFDVLPRHGHGPPEQIVDGRLLIQGLSCLSARDVYTGRVLWKKELPNLETKGQYFDYTFAHTALSTSTNQQHIAGANVRGSNFVATKDLVYIEQKDGCLVLDITNGDSIASFSIISASAKHSRPWGYIGVDGENLIAGLDFIPFSTRPELQTLESDKAKLTEKELNKLAVFSQFDYSASRTLVVLDRHSGSLKWSLESRYGFIHNAVVAGNGRLFCLDKLPIGLEKRRQRRGLSGPEDYRLLCLDMETGRIIWEKSTDIFGSWLGYAQEQNGLLLAARPSRDMVTDEKGERMALLDANNGRVIWDKMISYNNPPIIHHDQIITDNASYYLRDGEARQRKDPITGVAIPWSYARTHGCNYVIAAENLLSFRSAAAGFYDLEHEGGTGNLGGFKSGCTSNLIAANGVLNAPDYTRTCQCSYQNQTSLAFVYMPELEYWTSNNYVWNGQPVIRLGLNLNAAGDRLAEDGTLWLDFPSQGGPSPDVPVKYDSSKVRGLRRHSMTQVRTGAEWITSSGLVGPMKLEILLSGTPMTDTYYTVKLYFSELENIRRGDRIFNVQMQDSTVLHDFDILAEAGALNTAVVKTFADVQVEQKLIVQCAPVSINVTKAPLLCGIEIIQQSQQK
jgi:outer membrane protein assembly factor BamB